jgi:hypothetical protein
MGKWSFVHILLVCCVFCSISARAKERATFVVAKDGSGDYTTIQAAINAVDSTKNQWAILYIKNGTYNEHVLINKSNIALVGQNRDSTIITYNLPRTVWSAAHSSKTSGSGVIDIGVLLKDTVSTVATRNTFIGNLTAINSYDTSDDYTHVIKGESYATKIVTVFSNIWCNGEDTFAPWDKLEGMYYQAYNSYKGTIDAVCPRGWCYDIGSTFIEGYTSSPIWLEANVSGQKFVVRRAYVTGKTKYGFKLTNTQGSGAEFDFIDCHFSPRVTAVGKGTCSFYNTEVDSTVSWVSNGLSKIKADSMTALWTFNNVWDPEDSMPAALPFAAIPQPSDSAYDVATSPTLKWIGARNATSYNVYFGTTKTPSLVSSQTTTSYTTGSLSANTLYYWRVDAVTDDSVITGSLWRMVTGSTTGTEEPQKTTSGTFRLYQNYPNPFNPATLLTYELPANGYILLEVYDMLGRKVATLADGWQTAGTHQASFHAQNISSGMYFAKLQTESHTASIKLLLTK